MALTNSMVTLFGLAQDVLHCQCSGQSGAAGSAIGIGAHNFDANWKTLKRTGVATISKLDIEAHRDLVGREADDSSRVLTRKFFAHYGYTKYQDLDIYDRADLVFNLNDPLPGDLRQKYDLVFDPTSNYVIDVNQSFINTSQMLKIGGVKIVNTIVGDQTNQFDLKPSPNYLIDFHLERGFELEKVVLIDRKSRVLPYMRYALKVAPITGVLPFRLFLLYMVKLFFRELFETRRAINKAAYTDYSAVGKQASNGSGPTQTPSLEEVRDSPVASGNGRRTMSNSVLKLLLSEGQFSGLRTLRNKYQRRFRNFLFEALSPDWVAWIILRKVSEVDVAGYHITGHYRDSVAKSNQTEWMQTYDDC